MTTRTIIFRVTIYLAGIAIITASAYYIFAKTRITGSPSHSVYVWQRRWTPELAKTLTESGAIFASAHILAYQAEPTGRIIQMNLDQPCLRSQSMPLVATIRLPDNCPETVWDSLPRCISRLSAKGQPAWSGVEIDYDCPTSKLTEYASRLSEFRTFVPASMKLFITALPTWTTSPSLSSLTRTVDCSILQVHSISSPSSPIFDKNLAYRQIVAFSKITRTPFLAALPAYSSRLYTDESGIPVGIENESIREDLHGMPFRELTVNPSDVAALITTIRSARITRLNGFIWFRLPLASEKRSWKFAALRAVVLGEPLSPKLVLLHETGGGTIDLAVANRGSCDAMLPSVSVHGKIEWAEAFPLYYADFDSTGFFFKPKKHRVLPAGSRCIIGWVRADSAAKCSLSSVIDQNTKPLQGEASR